MGFGLHEDYLINLKTIAKNFSDISGMGADLLKSVTEYNFVAYEFSFKY
jgi:hypothetical protein